MMIIISEHLSFISRKNNDKFIEEKYIKIWESYLFFDTIILLNIRSNYHVIY